MRDTAVLLAVFLEAVGDVADDGVEYTLGGLHGRKAARRPGSADLRGDGIANGEELQEAFAALDLVQVAGVRESVRGAFSAIRQMLVGVVCHGGSPALLL